MVSICSQQLGISQCPIHTSKIHSQWQELVQYLIFNADSFIIQLTCSNNQPTAYCIFQDFRAVLPIFRLADDRQTCLALTCEDLLQQRQNSKGCLLKQMLYEYMSYGSV
jgi:hypothetical protein